LPRTATSGNLPAVRVNHIGLPVREEARSLAFYATYLGFDPATARRYPDGTVIVRNADGFDLALHPGDVPTGGETFLHFGFNAALQPGAVGAFSVLTASHRHRRQRVIAAADPGGIRRNVRRRRPTTRDCAGPEDPSR
jgi:catechol 2,3-dioxygenase-like lactoylglutathione lyase family enzyme